jgi:hypothetical protein
MRGVCFRWRGFAGSILSSKGRRQHQINKSTSPHY